MLEKIKTLSRIDVYGTGPCVSVSIDSVILEDGTPITKETVNTKGFIPGEIEEVKTWLMDNLGLTLDQVNTMPEVSFIQSKWTQQAIDAYTAIISKPME